MKQATTAPSWHSTIEFDRNHEVLNYQLATFDHAVSAENDERYNRPKCLGSPAARWAFPKTTPNPCSSCEETSSCESRARKVQEVFWKKHLPKCFGATSSGSGAVDCDTRCNECGLQHDCRVAAMVLRAHDDYKRLPSTEISQDIAQQTEQPSVQSALPSGGEQPVEVHGSTESSKGTASGDAPVQQDSDGKPSNASALTGTSYAFPVGETEYLSALTKFRSMPTPELKNEVNSLKGLVNRPSGTDYARHRAKVCAAAIVMNERGSGNDRCPAPAFRRWMPVVRAPASPSFSDQDELLASDRRTVDLDWLARHGRPQPREQFRNLFIDGELNFSAANEFVASRGSAEAKGKLLGLTSLGELPLGMLKSAATRSRWADLCRLRDSALRKIRDALARTNTRTTDDAELLWDIFAAHELTGGATPHICELVPLMGHGEVRKEQVPRKTKWLREVAGLPLAVPVR